MSTNPSKPSAVERLIAESDINRLIATYVHNLDDGKVEDNAKLLSDARFKVVDVVVTGEQNIAQFFRNNVRHHKDGTPRTWHTIANTLIEMPSATTASAQSYFTVHQQADDLRLQPIVAGRYDDSFGLINGEWRFVSRAIVPRLFGDVSHHVIPPAAVATA